MPARYGRRAAGVNAAKGYAVGVLSAARIRPAIVNSMCDNGDAAEHAFALPGELRPVAAVDRSDAARGPAACDAELHELSDDGHRAVKVVAPKTRSCAVKTVDSTAAGLTVF